MVSTIRREEPADPVRIFPDAAGAGKSASISFLSRDNGHQPTWLVAQADKKLQDLAATSNKIYILGIVEAVATVSQPRGR